MVKRVLMTGVGGFVGHHCLEYFLEHTDWELVCLDSFRHKGTYQRVLEVLKDNPRVEIFRHDLTVPIDRQLRNKLLNVQIENDSVSKKHINYIINIASNSAVERSTTDPAECCRNNHDLMCNMLEFARELEGLECFLHLSSDEVYGEVSPDSKGHKEWDVIMPGNPYCVLPETRILTNDGWVEIQDFNPLKDQLVSKTSSTLCTFKKANKKFRYSYSGNIRKIRTVVGNISTTMEHKFFRMETRFSNTDGLINENGDPISKRPHQKIVEVPAKLLSKGDTVLCTRYIPFPKDKINHNQHFARFLGYFVGDGSYSSKSKYVRLADEKKEYLEYYKNILKTFLKSKKIGHIYKHSSKNCWYLQFASSEIRERVNLSSKNEIMQSVLKFDEETVSSFIGGFLDAESHFRVNKNVLKSIKCFQKDKFTLDVIKLVLHRLGIVSSVNAVKNGFVLLISDSMSLEICCKKVPTLKYKDYEFPKKQKRHWNKYFYWCRILDIEDFDYDGEVFDLEVSKHHNYIAEFFVVHNSASKAAQEALAISYWRTYHLPVVIANCMNLIAERQDPEKFLPKIIQRVALNEEMPIYCDQRGEEVFIGSRVYLHVKNLADAMIFICNHRPAMYSDFEKTYEARPDRYNICGDVELNNLELAQLVAKIMDKELKYKLVESESARPGYDRRYALDGSKLKSLGWKSPISFEESIEMIVKWTMKNPHWII